MGQTDIKSLLLSSIWCSGRREESHKQQNPGRNIRVQVDIRKREREKKKQIDIN